jgi:hypothetical protein
VTLYAQQGYGKADKLNRLGDAGKVGGVVLSPADEGWDTMRQTVRDMTARGVASVLDPQTYVYTIPDGFARCHDEFGLAFGPMTWGSLTAADIDRHVAAVIAANDGLGVNGPVIAPTARQLSFADPWTATAFQYGRALKAATAKPTLASVVIEQAGLGDWTAIEQWLDIATTLDVAGFYLVIGRQGSYPTAWDTGLLANFMRLVYRLAVLNDYRIIVGYTDVSGLAALAMGAEAIASGWSYRQRHFLSDRWVPKKGGAHAIPRVTSLGLMASILAIGEGESSARSALAGQVLPDVALRRRIDRDAAGWSNPEAQLQYLDALSDLVRAVEAVPDASGRLDRLGAMVAQARVLIRDLLADGVRIDPVHTTSLVALGNAITTARREEGV